MTPAELNKAIQDRQLPEILCLYGQEQYLVEQAAKKVRMAVLDPQYEDFNFQQFFGKEMSAQDVTDAALTLPMFSSRRLVMVKDTHLIPAAEMEGFLAYFKDPSPETCLLFMAEKIDSRKKFFQAIKKYGGLVEFKPLYDNQIPGFVREILSASGHQMTEDALGLFCARVGSQLQEVQSELGKLQLYLGERTLVDTADVEAVVSSSRSENIFELGNAVGQGAAGKALSISHHLVADGEAPLKILALLVRHYRQLWKTRELQVQGLAPREIARKAGVHPFFVEGMIRQGKRFSRQDFLQAFEWFVQADLGMKSSGSDAVALLDQLLLRLVSRGRTGPVVQ